MLNDITIQKVGGGLGRRNPGQDMVSALVANGVSETGGVQTNTSYLLRSIEDANALLIDEAYDTDNNVFVYEHIKDFFRVNPSGTLWIFLVSTSMPYEVMAQGLGGARELLNEAGGTIRQIAFAYNPPVQVNDNTALLAAIPMAQELADWSYSQHMPVEVLLEGKGFDSQSVEDLRNKDAENVTVMIGQNLTVGQQDWTYAAVGLLLGAVSLAAVNENVGWVQRFNLSGGYLENPGIEGEAFTKLSPSKVLEIHEKGYVFLRNHVGISGVYLNDSFTATELANDYAYIENNRTIHKAVRLIRQALLPRLNSPVTLDPEQGTLSPEVVKAIESEGRRALENMLRDQEASDTDVFVDPEQDILATSELKVDFAIVPTGTARKFKVTIGFQNPF